jgi:thiol-disulfide isomerase/thioredoxin
MPLTPTNSKAKAILVLIFISILGLVIYFRVHNSRQLATIDIPRNEKVVGVSIDTIMEDGVIDDISDEATTTEKKVVKGYYGLYDESRLSEVDDGAKVVLFFNASWCPTCQVADRELASAQIPDGLVILSVDYDSYSTLKKKYFVTYQHTFVQVNADGDLIKKWSGGGLENIVKMFKS